MKRRRVRGFTLLEVLVALAIFATVAGAVLSAAARSLNNAGRLTEMTLAGWIADNRLTELQLDGETAALGRQTQKLDYANRQWQLETEVESTSDPALRRITVWVARADASVRQSPRESALTSLTGFLEVR